MWTDIVDLNTFYASSLGQVARRLIRVRLRERWPDVTGMTVLGLGYATPYLRGFKDEAERVIGVMPAHQGVTHWPRGAPNLVTLAGEAELPLPDQSVDRLLMVHAVECSESLRPMMREAWRVLAGGGRLMIVAPNRRGLWARFDRTPFGHGRPYSLRQLRRLLRDTMFDPVESGHALYVPPSRSRMLLRSAPMLERIGELWFTALSGVVIVEATKQVYAATPMRESRRLRRAVFKPVSYGATARDDQSALCSSASTDSASTIRAAVSKS